MQSFSFSKILFLCFVLVAQAAILPPWTLPFLGLGTPPPPPALQTTDISPQCGVNNGTYLCCDATFNGGAAIIKGVTTDRLGYQLPANTLNGYLCAKDVDTCPKAAVPVCCEVMFLFPFWGLWCQSP
ncbi:hypothetical protein TWF694_010419 [Orbilia ellipsospora]|uniref:Hydrophobin n=1 Tax=Orbilia ellipsospora TaxID=2528407 RepID=A0AAV9XCH8_9PEZI